MASVELKNADLFQGPSDLLVLPCSTAGTITNAVRNKLAHYRIPPPTGGMELGDVEIQPFEGGESIAPYIAYAASVRADSSTERAIHRIGEQLGQATKKYPSIQLVAVPLLGAGAGGLDAEVVVEALSRGFKSAARQDARLVIHFLDEGTFRRVVTRRDGGDPERWRTAPPNAKRVFISYSHTSPEHKNWVIELATMLRKNGVDARLDVWHLRPGMDLPQFMSNELQLAERVVIIADERYTEKADGKVGGVGWETMLIQGEMFVSQNGAKVMAIVRSREMDEGLPRYLKTKFALHWPDTVGNAINKDILLKELYDVTKAPPLGPPPVLV